MFAAVSIRKRDSEISVGISESEQPQAEASDPSAIDHAFNQSGEGMGAEYPSVGGCGCQRKARHLICQLQMHQWKHLNF